LQAKVNSLDKEMTKRVVKWSAELAIRAEENKVKCLRISDGRSSGLATYLVAFGTNSQKLIKTVIALATA